MAGEIQVPIEINLTGIPALLSQYAKLFNNLATIAARPIKTSTDLFSVGENQKAAAKLTREIEIIQKDILGAVEEGRKLGLVMSEIVPASKAVAGHIAEESAAMQILADRAREVLALENQRINIPRQEALSREIGSGGTFGTQLSLELKKARQEAVAFRREQGLSSESVITQVDVLERQSAVLNDSAQAFSDYAKQIANLPLGQQIAAWQNYQKALRSAAQQIDALRKLEKGKEQEDKRFTEDLRDRRAGYLRLAQGANVYINSVKAEIAAQQKASKSTAELNKEHDLLNDRIAIAIGKLLRYRIAFFVLRGAMDSVRDSLKSFIDTQSALAQLEKVVDPLTSNMTELRDIGFGLAKAYAVSIDEVVKVMTLWAQTGLDTNETIHATRAALKATNATNVEATAIVEALTSAIFAYGVTAEETTQVVDKWIAVQAKFPATAEDLLRALQGIGVVAKDFGVTIDDLNGLVAGIGAITRKSGNQVADALKTILARLPRAETIEAFQDIGVAVLKADGSFRPFVDILRDTAKATKNLNQVQIANLALTASGIRRYVEFTAALQNFHVIEDAIAVSMTSAGASTRAANIEVSTFGAQIRQMQAGLKEAGFAIGEQLSKPLTVAINALNFILEVFSRFKGVLLPVTAGLIAFGGIAVTLIVTSKGLAFIYSLINKKLAEYNKTLTVATLLSGKFNAAQRATGAATVSLAGAFGLVLGKLSPYLIAFSALASILSIIFIKTEEYNVILDETTESLKGQVDALLATVNGLQEHNRLLSDLIDQRESLVKKVDTAETDDERLEAAEKLALFDKSLSIGRGKVLKMNQQLLSGEIDRAQSQQIFVEALTEEIRLNSEKIDLQEKAFQRRKAEVGLIEQQRAAAEKTRQAVLDSQDTKAFDKFKASVSGLSDIPGPNFTADRGAFAQLTKGIFESREAQIRLSVASKNTKQAIGDLENGISAFQDELKADPEVDQTRVGRIIEFIKSETAPTTARLKALKETLDDLRGGILVSPDKVRQANVLLSQIGETGADVSSIIANAISSSVGEITQELEKTDQVLNDLSADSATEAAERLKDNLKDVKDLFVDFLKPDVLLQFVRQLNKIKEEVGGLESKLSTNFLSAGIEQDAKRRADAVASLISSNLSGLLGLTDSINSALDAAIERRDFLEKRAIEDPVGESVRDPEGKELKEAIKLVKTLEYTRNRLLPDINDLTKQQTKELRKANVERARQNLLEAQRAAVLQQVETHFQNEIEVFQTLGINQGIILGIDRERLFLLTKHKQAQLALVSDTESQAKLLEELNGLAVSIAKNATEANLFKLKRDMEQAIQLAQSLQSVLSSSFSNISTDIVRGIEQRKELSLDIKEAEIELQKAIADGDQAAIESAKFRIKELKAELNEFKAVIFELRQLGKSLFTGIADSLNKAVSDKFAKDIIELDIDGQQLGTAISAGILDVNNVHIQKLITVNNDFLAKLQAIMNFDIEQRKAALARATAATTPGTADDKAAEALSEVALDTLNKDNKRIAQETTRSLEVLQSEIADTRVTLEDVFKSGLLQIASVVGAAIGAAVGGGGPSASAGGQIGGLAGKALGEGKAIGAVLGSFGGPIGTVIGSAIGGALGGLFDDRKSERFIGAFEANTVALKDNTLAIKQLDRNIINAPSNFVFPQVFGGGQGPSIQVNVNGSGSPEAVANRVVDVLSRQLSVGARIGTTRRSAFG